MKGHALLVFLKKPVPGKVKTRLAQSIGPEAAAAVYHKLLDHHLKWLGSMDCLKFAFHDDFDDPPAEFLNVFDHWVPQTDGDLGVRMMNAFETAFHMGHSKAVIIGTDCPAIGPNIVGEALSRLEYNQAVIGPSLDGGYYLLALKEVYPELFLEMEWSNERVLEESLQRAENLGIKTSLLESLRDIDHASDLDHYPEFKVLSE